MVVVYEGRSQVSGIAIDADGTDVATLFACTAGKYPHIFLTRL